jgi:hypothetical protein
MYWLIFSMVIINHLGWWEKRDEFSTLSGSNLMGTLLTQLVQFYQTIFQIYNAVLHQHGDVHVSILREIKISDLCPFIGCKLDKGHMFSVSDWLLFNIKWAIFQLYHSDNRLLLSWDDDTRQTNWIGLAYIAHWNNTPQVGMILPLNTLSWLWAKQSLVLFFTQCCVLSRVVANISIDLTYDLPHSHAKPLHHSVFTERLLILLKLQYIVQFIIIIMNSIYTYC